MVRSIFASLAFIVLPALAQEKGKALPWINNVKLSGFAMVQYQHSTQENNDGNSFNLRMARITLDGRAAKDFYWKAQMQVNGNTSTLGSSPRLVDLFVEWQKFSFCKVKVGEFQLPFTFENPMHPIDQGFMNNGMAVLNLVNFSDRSGTVSSNGRDIGIQVQGDFLSNSSGRNLLHYAVSVVNGQGINTGDVDKRKTVIGGLWVEPVAGLRIGAFGWEGSYARKGTWTDETTGEERSGVRSLPQHRYALSAEYKADDWTFRTEYIHSTGYAFAKSYKNSDDASASDCTLAAKGNKADGCYALVIAPVLKNRLHVKARYDLYRQSASWSSSKAQYEVGADYMFSKNLGITAEYVRVNDRALQTHNYNMFDAQMTLKF